MSWERFQSWLYSHTDLGIFVDISRVRLEDSFVATLQPAFVAAFAAMAELEAGAIANPDEQRQVGHYWLRAPALAPTPALRSEIETTLTRIETFAAQVQQGVIAPPSGGTFTDLLAVGIGGSALGPQFVAAALAPNQPPLRIHFIDNTDPDGMDRVLASLRDRLHSTLVSVTSKSGATPEPRNGMVEVQAALAKAGLPFEAQAIAITGVGSHLDQQAQGWLARFPMADWVGGRTSVFSAVGLVPAALQGIDIRGLLAGARQMDEATRVPELTNNPAALLALAWYWLGKGHGQKDMVVLPYKDRLLLFSRYLQQLVMESLGKAHDLDGALVEQGIAVYGNKGSTDQHAYVQQLRDGLNNFFVTFIEVLRDREGASPELEPGVTAGDYLTGFLLGTREALYDNGRDSITVTLPRVDAVSVGALIALYERAVGLYASLINVNAYHQPGVEAGKKAAAVILALQQRLVATLTPTPQTLAALAASLEAEPETLYFIARHLAANERGLTVTGSWFEPASVQLSRL